MTDNWQKAIDAAKKRRQGRIDRLTTSDIKRMRKAKMRNDPPSRIRKINALYSKKRLAIEADYLEDMAEAEKRED